MTPFCRHLRLAKYFYCPFHNLSFTYESSTACAGQQGLHLINTLSISLSTHNSVTDWNFKQLILPSKLICTLVKTIAAKNLDIKDGDRKVHKYGDKLIQNYDFGE